MTRRGFLKSIGVAAVAAAFAPQIAAVVEDAFESLGPTITPSTVAYIPIRGGGPIYVNCANQIAALKELYAGKMDDLIYNENPFITLVKREKNS